MRLDTQLYQHRKKLEHVPQGGNWQDIPQIFSLETETIDIPLHSKG